MSLRYFNINVSYEHINIEFKNAKNLQKNSKNVKRQLGDPDNDFYLKFDNSYDQFHRQKPVTATHPFP